MIVAARPAMGKTSFCLNVAQHASLKAGETVGLFSLEMSKEQLVLRLHLGRASTPTSSRARRLWEKDWALDKPTPTFPPSEIFIDSDSATVSPLEMRAKCRRLKAEFGLGLIIVDYLQLMLLRGRAAGARRAGRSPRSREV